jgi:hypothetical protein
VAFLLPAKAPGNLRRLDAAYGKSGSPGLAELIQHCKVAVVEGVTYDNWDGGTHGHDLKLFLPFDIHSRIELDELDPIGVRIKDDINKLSSSISNEFINAVHLELDDEADPHFAGAVAVAGRRLVPVELVAFWRPGFARLFISHRDIHKGEARDLAEALEGYGISCFVAHDTIRPMSEWRSEIMKGLETMDIMLAFVTDDFAESIWTMQEVGFALGRNVPVLSLKLGRKDPPGFISHVQALKGRIDNPASAARGLFPIIADTLNRRGRLQDVMLRAFLDSPSFLDARDRFDRMQGFVTKLTDSQVAEIIEGFPKNSQLFGSVYLTSGNARLRRFLEAATGEKFEIDGKHIRRVPPRKTQPADDDDIPF